MNVLLVDDEYLELEQLFQLIYNRYPHWHIYTADDGITALEMASEHNIHLALLDIQLYGESGLDLAEKLQEKSIKLDIVIVTAYQNFDYAKRAIKLNVMDYIVKPIVERELYDVLDKYIRQNSMHNLTPLMQKVLNFIQERYQENLHLQDIADFVHVSPNYLSKKFNEELNLSFKDYLAQVRINQAKQLMNDHPEYSIQYISDSVGFSTQNYFTNSFKKYEKMTPTQFKHGKAKSDDK
ncbi:response regulator [Sporolactobacillus sp. THM7-4]|nr:response regulator [Sporolactobacillus sp. THM7-4]